MIQTKIGIDGLDFTIDTAVDLNEIVSAVFGVPIQHWRKQQDFKIKWYKTTFYLKSTDNAVLAAVHTDPISKHERRHLIQIHGLCFSNYALNPLSAATQTVPPNVVTVSDSAQPALFEPMNLHRVLNYVHAADGRITDFDFYLDTFSPVVPFDELQRQALPANLTKYIRSPFNRIVKNRVPVPRILENSIYIGRRTNGACQIICYSKHNDPHHRINEPDNQMKQPWYRFEVRLRDSTGRSRGAWLLQEHHDRPEDLKKNILHLITTYLGFVEPKYSRISLNPLQTWWFELIAAAEKAANRQ